MYRDRQTLPYIRNFLNFKCFSKHFFANNPHGQEKVWHGNTFCANNLATKQRNTKLMKIQGPKIFPLYTVLHCVYYLCISIIMVHIVSILAMITQYFYMYFVALIHSVIYLELYLILMIECVLFLCVRTCLLNLNS